MRDIDLNRFVSLYQSNLISRRAMLVKMGLEEPEWRQETQAERDTGQDVLGNTQAGDWLMIPRGMAEVDTILSGYLPGHLPRPGNKIWMGFDSSRAIVLYLGSYVAAAGADACLTWCAKQGIEIPEEFRARLELEAVVEHLMPDTNETPWTKTFQVGAEIAAGQEEMIKEWVNTLRAANAN